MLHVLVWSVVQNVLYSIYDPNAANLRNSEVRTREMFGIFTWKMKDLSIIWKVANRAETIGR